MKMILWLMAVRFACAQAADFSPVEVKAQPDLIPLGGKVTLAGHTGLEGAARTVKLTVKAADGTRSDLTAQANDAGDFSVVFATSADGRHEVEAVSPSGRDRAQTSFLVAGQQDIEEAIPQRQAELVATAEKALAAAEGVLARTPVSPAREEMKAKLAPLKAKLAATRSTAELKRALQSFERLRGAGVGPIAYQPVFGQLTEWSRQSGESRQRVERQLAKANQASARCDALHELGEALQAMSVVLNLIERPFAILVNFAKDYDAKKLPGLPKNPAQAALAGTIIKSFPDLLAGPLGVAKIAITAATDVAQFAAQQYFDKYCVKFEGPIEASTAAQYLRNGTAWRKSSQKLVGRLTLRYPKEAAGEAVRLSGEFVGYGTNFTHWDDAIPILFKQLAKQSLIFRKTVLPAVEAAAEEFLGQQGQAVNAVRGGGFRIPVEGELVGTKIRLRLQAAATDMGDVKARVICYVGGPHLLSPVRNNYEFEFQKAHQILSAAMGSRKPEDVIELDVTVDRGAKVMTIEREFKGTRGSKTGLAYADYTLKLKVTNPPQ